MVSIWQAYYLPTPFPIEKAPTKKITTMSNGVKIFELLNYPVRGLVFEGGNSLENLAKVVSDSCIFLQNTNIPYNVLIADSGKRIFLLPQVLGLDPIIFPLNPDIFKHLTNCAFSM